MRSPAGEDIVDRKQDAALVALLVDKQVKTTSQQDHNNALGRSPARCGGCGISIGGSGT